MGRLGLRPGRFRRAFILLEVMVGVVIVGVAMVALLRGFMISLDQIKKVKRNEQAILLARSFMDDMILEPPAEGRFEGNFGEDPRWGEKYEDWYWRLQVETDEPDYEERPEGTLFQELETLYYVRLEILKEDTVGSDTRTLQLIDVYTISMEPDIFSPGALQGNQLF